MFLLKKNVLFKKHHQTWKLSYDVFRPKPNRKKVFTKRFNLELLRNSLTLIFALRISERPWGFESDQNIETAGDWTSYKKHLVYSDNRGQNLEPRTVCRNQVKLGKTKTLSYIYIYIYCFLPNFWPLIPRFYFWNGTEYYVLLPLLSTNMQQLARQLEISVFFHYVWYDTLLAVNWTYTKILECFIVLCLRL